jgi:hypothetical protein
LSAEAVGARLPRLAITADPLDPERVNMFERCESRGRLDAWRAVMAPRSEIRRRTVDVMIYVISDVRPPFG